MNNKINTINIAFKGTYYINRTQLNKITWKYVKQISTAHNVYLDYYWQNNILQLTVIGANSNKARRRFYYNSGTKWLKALAKSLTAIGHGKVSALV